MTRAATSPALLLTVDQGNTTTDCCLFAGETVLRRQRLAAQAADLLTFVGAERPARMAALSVRPERLAPIEALAARLGLRVELAGRDLLCPLRNAYHVPAELGADRWVGAWAAHRRFGTAVTVDCGTAATVNLVAEGEFRGGAITAGFATTVRGLAAAAPVLDVDVSQPPREVPARSTVEALRLGLRVGWAGMLERLVQEVRASAPAAVVVVTGGEAPVFLAHTRLECHAVPDLNHQGLRLLLSPP